MSGQRGISCVGYAIDSGSPPHEWGQLLIKPLIIINNSVHPHMSGDNKMKLGVVLKSNGSPPHEWGQLSYGLRL